MEELNNERSSGELKDYRRQRFGNTEVDQTLLLFY